MTLRIDTLDSIYGLARSLVSQASQLVCCYTRKAGEQSSWDAWG